MFNPELMKLAQEQMSRMPPEELARIQQQMMSNPDLMKLATDSMKNLRPEDVRRAAEQLKHAKPEEMAEISEKMANAKPEDIAAMKAHAEAQVSYALNAAKMLKQQGNELHSHGRYYEATNKYKLAKDNLKDIPTVKSGTLQLQCSANLMSCYLRTKQFDECIKEGSEVLSYDTKNVKALYRRGQAYRELGMFEAAVSDLEKAHEISPEDETIADVLRDATENLAKARKNGNVPHGLVIEEIVEEETRLPVDSYKSSSEEYSVTQPVEVGESSRSASGSRSVYPAADAEIIDSLKDNPDSIRLFQNYLANADPNSLAAMGGAGMPPDMVRTATEMINKMKPEELQKMLQLASSLNGNGGPMSNGSVLPSKIPDMSPEMLKIASDKMSKMSPEDIQKMVDIASSMNMNGSPFPGATTYESTQRSSNDSQPSVAGSSSTGISDLGESTSGGLFSNSRMDPSSSIPPGSTADMQENMRNSMKDPAMRQMLTSMMKNMSPEMMSNMSEQFGVKLSKEDAQAMSSLSPDDLDKMMRWAGKAQSGIETARKTKNWILGKPGMILAICMLILAFIFNRLGFIGS